MKPEIIVALIGFLGIVVTSINTIVNTVITKKMNRKIDTINSLKYENDKTYLTDYLSELEQGQTKTEIQKKRACEIYDEYSKLGGNSYIHTKWEQLKKEGKL